MRQGIEKEREYELLKASIIVMFHGSLIALGGFVSFRARERAALALRAKLAVHPFVTSPSSSLSVSLTEPFPPDCNSFPLPQSQKASSAPCIDTPCRSVPPGLRPFFFHRKRCKAASALFGAGHCQPVPFLSRRLGAAVRYIRIPLPAPSLVVVN